MSEKESEPSQHDVQQEETTVQATPTKLRGSTTSECVTPQINKKDHLEACHCSVCLSPMDDTNSEHKGGVISTSCQVSALRLIIR